MCPKKLFLSLISTVQLASSLSKIGTIDDSFGQASKAVLKISIMTKYDFLSRFCPNIVLLYNIMYNNIILFVSGLG
jgi:hypothetical protein